MIFGDNEAIVPRASDESGRRCIRFDPLDRGELKRGRGSESEGNIRFIWGCLDSSDDGNTGPLDGRRCGTWA